MTDTEIRIAMAELEGWSHLRAVPSLGDVRGVPTTGYRGSYIGESGDAWTPDYPNDLNAVHRVQEALTKDQRLEYQKWLEHFSTFETRFASWHIIHATARQRCEAILKTCGKWKE
jgi:hypothetical protein